MEIMLKVEGITKYFRPYFSLQEIVSFRKKNPICALHEVSLSLEKNKILCILGPNGAGKTTLLKIISQLIIADKGKISVNGSCIENEIKPLVGLLLDEERSFYWRLSGRQNLEFFAALYGLSRKTFKIDYADKKFGIYSTGMKKNFALMRSMLHEPVLLLLDEPTKSLDYQSSLKLKNLIKNELAGQQAKTIIVCTHNIDEAVDFADIFIILHKGKILAQGSLESLRTQMHEPYLKLSDIFLKLTANNQC